MADADTPAAFAAGVLNCNCFFELAMFPASSLRSSDGDLGVAFAVLGLAALAFETGVFAGIVKVAREDRLRDFLKGSPLDLTFYI